MTERTARLLFVVLAAVALTMAYVVYPTARAVRAVYWWSVALICAAVHAILGDDDLADPTMRDRPPMPGEALFGYHLARLALMALAAVGAVAALALGLAMCGLPSP